MPESVYIDEETKRLLNIFMAIENITSYEEAVRIVVDIYYNVVKHGEDYVVKKHRQD